MYKDFFDQSDYFLLKSSAQTWIRKIIILLQIRLGIFFILSVVI